VRELKITAVGLGADRTKLSLTLPEIAPVQQMEIQYNLKGADGAPVTGTLENTIHVLGQGSK
jgi:hypothetical protein